MAHLDIVESFQKDHDVRDQQIRPCRASCTIKASPLGTCFERRQPSDLLELHIAQCLNPKLPFSFGLCISLFMSRHLYRGIIVLNCSSVSFTDD